MEFRKNAHVVAASGEKVGRIDRVVVDPGNGEITHLVVRKGLLLTEDKVVPVSAVAETSDDTVRLDADAPSPEALLKFEKDAFIPAGGYEDFKRREAQEARRLIWYHTGISTPWWVNGLEPMASKPLYVRKDRRNNRTNERRTPCPSRP